MGCVEKTRKLLHNVREEKVYTRKLSTELTVLWIEMWISMDFVNYLIEKSNKK